MPPCPLTTLLYFAKQPLELDDPIREHFDKKLIGDWETVQPGQRVIITFEDPYRVEHGFLFTLPGLGIDFFNSAIIQVPHCEEDPDTTLWFTFKDLICLASTIELEPFL